MGDDDYSSLEIEIETLKSIYIHELEINHDDRGRPSCVIVHLYPATADNVTEQFVRLSLILWLPSEYPQDIPEISIRNTRGLSDEEIESIYQAIQTLAEERKGNAMLFELIEVAKEHLTGINIPSCECAICLYGFVNDDVLTKTECFHYFHTHCLDRYVRHTLKGKKDADDEAFAEDSELDTMIACPVCRLPVSFPLSDKEFPPPAESEKVDVSISMDHRKLQEGMQELFIKQKVKGGIIDLEAERNKFLLEISIVPDSAASNNNIETVNQHIEQCVTEYKESHVENVVKTAKISSEILSESEENHLGESNEDKNRYSKPIRNQHKQYSMFSSQSERHKPSEKNLECSNSTKDNIQQNENRKQEIFLQNEEVHASDAVGDIQQGEVISRSGHGYRTMQRGKMSYRGPNKRHFRGNHYPRQLQNRGKRSYDKKLQHNQYEHRDEVESYLPKQSSTNSTIDHSNTEVDRVLGSKKDSSEIKEMETDKRPKSSRTDTDVYGERKNENRSKYFGKNSKKYETEEREEYSREKKNEYIEEESEFAKNVDLCRKTEKGGRKYFSGKYSKNYRSEQRFKNGFQNEVYMENTQNKGYTFQDKNSNGQSAECESSKNEVMRKSGKTIEESYINNSLQKFMPQNQNRSKQPNMRDLEYPMRDRNNKNGDRRFNSSRPRLEHNRSTSSGSRKFRQNNVKECSETGNIDHSWIDSRSDTNEVSLQEAGAQKMGRQADAELNESEFEVTLQPLTKYSERFRKEEKFKNVNMHDNNNYRGKYNNRRGFYDMANGRQYRYSNEGRENHNSKSCSEQENVEHKSNINHTQIASKNKVNKEFSMEISEPLSSIQETTVQLHSPFNETECEGILQSLKNEERYKNANDRNNYGRRPRGRRGFHYRTNERHWYTGEEGNNYKGKAEFEGRDDKRQLSEQIGQNSTNLILVETNADREENILKNNCRGNNIAHTLPMTGFSKSTKHRNLYFYPKSRGNYRNNNNRIADEANYHTQERHNYSKGSNILHSSNDDKIESVDATRKTETKEHFSHR